MTDLQLIGRQKELFGEDVRNNQQAISSTVKSSSFLIIGGAGTIGQAVVKEILCYDPKLIHVVDLSENNLVELVRDIRSGMLEISGEFKTYCLDFGSQEFYALMSGETSYDFIFNLAAIKHVRSEKDPFSIMRMINVNIINSLNLAHLARSKGVKKYFCVSTDKAANPVNMMGASKRIMEMFLLRESRSLNISMARFANVAFSDGSLLHGFNERISKSQPISAPEKIKRYFVTSREAGRLCLLSGLLGKNKQIFFPKLNDKLNMITFTQILTRYLEERGFEPVIFKSEEKARKQVKELISQKKWPCLFTEGDTTGEKDFEEFFTSDEEINLEQFIDLGIIENQTNFDDYKLDHFLNEIERLKHNGGWSKKELIDIFSDMIPDFGHKETGKYLDDQM